LAEITMVWLKELGALFIEDLAVFEYS